MKTLTIVIAAGLFCSLTSQANLAYRLQSAEVVGYDEQKVIVKVPGGKSNMKISRKHFPDRKVAYRGKVELVTGDKIEATK